MDKDRGFERKVARFLIVFFFLLTSFSKKKVVFAEEKISQSSATTSSLKKVGDRKEEKLRKFLESHHSPLASYSSLLIKIADHYSLDWRLLSAISGVESSFGKQIPPNSFNAYGWNNGRCYFRNWQDGIETVSKALKENYIDKGAETLEQIGPIYAPPSPFWAQRVAYFMKEIEDFTSSPLQFSL